MPRNREQQKQYEIRKAQAVKNLEKEILMEYKEVFSLFDKNQDGFINELEFAKIIITLGINPTKAELENLVLEEENPDKIDFAAFCYIMSKNKRKPDSLNDLISAFRIFDPKAKGTINSVTLKKDLTTMGEPFNPQETDSFLKSAQPFPDGRIDYFTFSKRIIGD